MADEVTPAGSSASPHRASRAVAIGTEKNELVGDVRTPSTFVDLVTAAMPLPNSRISGTTGEFKRFSVGVVAVLAAAGIIGTSSAEPATAQESASTQDSAEEITYEVQQGETLSEIAEDLNVDLAELADLNGIDELDTVVSGTTLSVPERTYEGPIIKHEVTSNETLSEIAESYGISTRLLQRLNQIEDPDHVLRGSTVEIPDLSAYFEALDADGSPTKRAEFVEEEASSSTGTDDSTGTDSADLSDDFTLSDDGRYRVRETEYLVVAGDTLSQIAEDHQVDTDSILQYNNIPDPSHVRSGETLIIPIREAIQYVDRLDASFEKWAKANDLDPNLVKAIGWQESHWNPEAVSSAGAVGITQIMPATADYISGKLIGTPLSRQVADENIRMGARYIAYLIELSGGNLDVAIASYYQGYTSVQRNGMRGDTQRYVAGVRGYIAEFESGALPDRDLVNSRSN